MKHFSIEPAVILYGINSLIALLVAFGLPMSQAQVAAVTTIATALLSIVTAALTRPVVVSTITAAVGTLATAVAAFGLHFSADQIGASVTVLSIVLALLLRQNVTPTVKASA